MGRLQVAVNASAALAAFTGATQIYSTSPSVQIHRAHIAVAKRPPLPYLRQIAAGTIIWG